MNICEHLSGTAGLFPDKEAIVFEGKRFSYSELDQKATAAAELLTRSGVDIGDRVAIMLPNVPAFVVWYFAALRVGGIAVSISTRLTGSEVAQIAEDCQAEILVSLAETKEAIQDSLPQGVSQLITTCELASQVNGELLAKPQAVAPSVNTQPGDAALILYTSGTTGFAKGATLSHANVRSNVHAFNHLCGMQTSDRVLLAVPLFHCFGQNALLNSVFNIGGTLVLQRRFDPQESRQLIKDESVSQLYGVPMMFHLLHDGCDPEDLATVKYCFTAAATMPLQTAERWQEKFGLPLHEGYGLTETSPFASYNHRVKFVAGSIGTPIDNVEMKIVDTETGCDCEAGELGEIAIRGPNVMLGYWNRPNETANAIRDGWFYSGDIGRVDKHGFFFIVDRVKDMISVGGQKVFPAEVERVLREHPQVDQIAVVGQPHAVFGEEVVAFVVPRQPLSDQETLVEELLDLGGQHLAAYKLPRRLQLTEELPRNPSGKILKRELRNRVIVSDLLHKSSAIADTQVVDEGKAVNPRSHRPPQLHDQLQKAFPSNRHEVANKYVMGLIKTLTESENEVSADTRFLDAGMDSLSIVEMSTQLQVEIGDRSEVPATLVFDHPRVCDLSDYLIDVLCESDSSNKSLGANETTPEKSDSSDAVHEMSEEQALQELLKELEA